MLVGGIHYVRETQVESLSLYFSRSRSLSLSLSVSLSLSLHLSLSLSLSASRKSHSICLSLSLLLSLSQILTGYWERLGEETHAIKKLDDSVWCVCVLECRHRSSVCAYC